MQPTRSVLSLITVVLSVIAGSTGCDVNRAQPMLSRVVYSTSFGDEYAHDRTLEYEDGMLVRNGDRRLHYHDGGSLLAVTDDNTAVQVGWTDGNVTEVTHTDRDASTHETTSRFEYESESLIHRARARAFSSIGPDGVAYTETVARTSFEYDELGRPTMLRHELDESVTIDDEETVAFAEGTTSYTWLDGRLTEKRTHGRTGTTDRNVRVSFSYDDDGLLRSSRTDTEDDNDTGAAPETVFIVSYDDQQRIEEVTSEQDEFVRTWRYEYVDGQVDGEGVRFSPPMGGDFDMNGISSREPNAFFNAAASGFDLL